MVAPWSLGRRIVFRFAVLVALLQVFPFPFGIIPGTGWVAGLLRGPWEAGVAWVARVILGIPEPSHVFNGSGDTTWHYVQLLLVAMLAAAGTLVWSIVDRRRAAYTRLAGAALVVLRYYLAFMLLTYGLAKLWELQFVAPWPYRLDGRIGDMSPMGMLWTFMGSSRPYTIFTGVLEILPALLLLSRRTALVGALGAVAVMTHVVVLNFSYDVPVKLFSLQLLAYAIALALPQLRRIAIAALGRAVPEVPPRTRLTPKLERVRAILRLAVVGSMVVTLAGYVVRFRDWQPPENELQGIWEVESFVADGAERPPLLTDPVRWRKLIVSRGLVTLRSMADSRTHHRAEIEAGTIRIQRGVDAEIWRYERSGDRLVVEGRHADHALRVTLRLEPEALLTSRGFHWINDEPFNR